MKLRRLVVHFQHHIGSSKPGETTLRRVPTHSKILRLPMPVAMSNTLDPSNHMRFEQNSTFSRRALLKKKTHGNQREKDPAPLFWMDMHHDRNRQRRKEAIIAMPAMHIFSAINKRTLHMQTALSIKHCWTSCDTILLIRFAGRPKASLPMPNIATSWAIKIVLASMLSAVVLQQMKSYASVAGVPDRD